MRSRRLANRPLVAVLVGAVVVIGLVMLWNHRANQLVQRMPVLEVLTHRIDLGVGGSHLWLEERLSGDTDPALDGRIYGTLEEARAACAVLRRGGRVGGHPVAPLAADMQPSVGVLCDRLALIQELTDRRLADRAAHGPGSQLDQDYDRLFAEIGVLSEEVHEGVIAEIRGYHTELGGFAAALVALLVATFGLVAAIVHRDARLLEKLSRRQTSTLDAIPDAVLRVAPSGTVLFANREARELIGRDAPDLEGLRVQDLIRPHDATGRPVSWERSALGAALRGEVRVGTADATCRQFAGGVFVAACTVAPNDQGDNGAGAVVVVRDVTESRAVAVERDELASIAAAAPDVALLGLPDGTVHWLNEAGRALLGFGRDEDITAYRIEDLFSPEEMARVYRDVMPVVVCEHEWSGQLTLLGRDGVEVPVSATFYAHHDASGNRRYVSSIMRDLRPRLDEERKLRESERRLADALRLARLGSWELDIASGEVTWSEELHRIFGTDPQRFVPTYEHFLSFVHADDRSAVEAAIVESAQGGEYAFEYRVVRPDGAVRTQAATWTVVSDEDRNPVRMVGTAQDVTELRAVDHLKNEFVSVVSHELRTPLTSIHGALRLLQTGLLAAQPARAQRMIDIAEANTERLIRLINDILDVERLASGKVDLRPCTVAVGDLVGRAVEAMSVMADEAAVHLAVDIAPLMLTADPDRVDQVLTNLLSNAIKFSPCGGTVRITAEQADGAAVVRVADEGRGIPDELLEQVFERFHQVDPTDSREKSGTGLGLTICRSIVEQHGGRIWARSQPGQGATLAFTLPLAPCADSRGHGERPGASTVLLCDDDDEGREALAALLAARRYDVVQASDGETAVKLAVAHRPAVIVLDLLLPGIDGWETAALLKERPETSSIPVVMCSVVPEAEAGATVGAVEAYVEKPRGASRLLDAVDRAAESRVRLLIVEDDDDLAHVLTASFQQHGLEVVHARTATAALEVCEYVVPDLVVLDLGLPDHDGLTVIDWLRRRDHLGDVPVVVYTAADLSHAEHRRLGRQATSVVVKSRVSPIAFERHVLALIDRITGKEGATSR